MSYNPETKMYEGYIYKITNRVNGKIYIGQTKMTPELRWSCHKYDAKHYRGNSNIQKAIRKYGIENFNHEILQKIECDTLGELIDKMNYLEIMYIKENDATNKNLGYNISIGGGRCPDYNKVKTYCFTPLGELLYEFDSRSEAGQFFGTTGEVIHSCILHKTLCHGYYFSNSEIFDYSPKYIYRFIPVDMYSMDGEYIKSFKNYTDAAKEYCLHKESVLLTCQGKYKSSGGYVFRFLYDTFDKYKRKDKKKKINIYKDDIFVSFFNSVKEGAEFIGCRPTNLSSVLRGKKKSIYGFVAYYAEDPNQPDKTKIVA